MTLQEFFQKEPEVAIAFSGGVDSAYLLYAAKQYARKVTAYYVKSAFQPQFELEDAQKLAKEIGAELKIMEVNVLEDETVASNPPKRCYYCKKRIFSAILQEAAADGYKVILDGTNASDDFDDRPGMVALQELSVLSPLKLCGLTKKMIRELSKEAGLFTWNKPAYACLATRIPTGTHIEERMLKRTENAEGYLTELGFSDFRVRTMGEAAKLQIRQEQFPLVLEHLTEIVATLKKDYSDVYLDLEARK